MLRLFAWIWKIGRGDLRVLWAALRHPARPWWLWPCALALTVFALSPWNIAIPLVGAVDDLVLLPLLLHVLVSQLPELRERRARSGGRFFTRDHRR